MANEPGFSWAGLVRLLTLILFIFVPSGVYAHALGEDYVFVNFRETSIDGEFQIHFSELREKLGLEIPEDLAAARAAVETAAPEVQAYIREHFAIGPDGGEPYRIEFTGTDALEAENGFGQYFFRADTGPIPERLAIEHTMFYDGDRLHRGLFLVQYNAKTGKDYGPEHTALVFSQTNSRQVLDVTDVPGLLGGWQMIWQGILHIWIGIDHILFLVALMLSTVLMQREDGVEGWRPVERFRRAFFNLLKIVTVFTVAHSLTLLLAALDVIELNSRFVESMIALSIVLVAVNNIIGKVREGTLLVILLLGLFHGLGFASVMGHLPFRMTDLLKMVVRFNVGVELGQMAIVAVLFPLLFLLRKSAWYVPAILKGGSVVLILVAGTWFVQRALGFG